MARVTPVRRGGKVVSWRRIIGGVLVSLGPDKIAAQHRATVLMAAHKAIVASDGRWDREAAKAVLVATGLASAGEAVTKTKAVVHSPKEQEEEDAGDADRRERLHETADAHVKHLEASAKRGSTSRQHATRARQTTAELKRLAPNLLLTKLRHEALTELRCKLIARDLSPATIATTLRYWRLMLYWAEDAGRWNGPLPLHYVLGLLLRLGTPAPRKFYYVARSRLMSLHQHEGSA